MFCLLDPLTSLFVGKLVFPRNEPPRMLSNTNWYSLEYVHASKTVGTQ